jgi:hypothetical protein
MPDVTSNQPADVRLWVSLDVHKLSIVAATLPPTGGKPEVQRIETTEKAIRRFIDKLAARRGWRSATRPGRAGSSSTGCSPGSGSAAMWSRRR